MAHLNIEAVVEELDENFERVLKSVFDDLVPGHTLDSRQIMRTFRMRLERGFSRWEHVSDKCVDAEY